jgi:catechol 2,3-dioxygenase-like lactoylglutathione lyase family enzyme
LDRRALCAAIIDWDAVVERSVQNEHQKRFCGGVGPRNPLHWQRGWDHAGCVHMINVRIARATNDLQQALRFYRAGLGLEILGSFTDHAGFDGVMLGSITSPFLHFEFTHQRAVEVAPAPTRENLIVFYLPDPAEWAARVQRMIQHGFQPVAAHNPYWDDRGKTFEDFEGYRVVLFNGEWKPGI